MSGETHLLATIAIGLTAAFIGGAVARFVRLPAIVGYLVAGMAIGPFTPGIVADQAIASELADLGVVLLMFGVGLHFSLRDLWSVRGVAVGALLQIVVTSALGTVIGIAFGWPASQGLLLGLALSVASTVVLLRALTERGELDTAHGRVAVGWLIVQDLFTVLALVLLPTAALLLESQGSASVEAALGEVGFALGRAALLVALMIAVGTRLLPRILLAVARDGSRELFTLAVLAAAIGLAFASSVLFGVSLALGAFLAGAVLAESDLSHQAASEALPMRDAFAVLFFVSIGMLIDPTFLLAQPVEVLAVLALVVGGNSLAALAVVLLRGEPPRTALTVAAGVAQVGEFSFILATLAVGLGLLPAAGFQLVVAAALLSITLNPAVFALADRVEPAFRDWSLVRRWQARVVRDLEPAPAASARTERRHAVVVGHGRVGTLIAWALERRGFGYVVIEQNRRVVEGLRERGIRALYGDGIDAELLRQAGIDQAAVLVVAVADPTTARMVVERARALAPRVEIVVRTHREQAAQSLANTFGARPVVSERELAVQMARLTLRRFGVSANEAEAIAGGLRTITVTRPPAPPGGMSGGIGRLGQRLRRALRPNEPSEPAAAPAPAEPPVVDPAPAPHARIAELG